MPSNEKSNLTHHDAPANTPSERSKTTKPAESRPTSPSATTSSTSPQDVAFEEIYQQNKNRIHYQLHKLGIHDPHNEFFTEGIYAMWIAYQKYQPNTGPMGTYFNYMIRYRLLDMLRKRTSDLNNDQLADQMLQPNYNDGNHHGTLKQRVVDPSGLNARDEIFWSFIQSRLTANQWKWLSGTIFHGFSLQEIADANNVTVNAVKSWSREARKRLRQEEENIKNMM